MDIQFACPQCGQSLEAPDDMEGRPLACPHCQGVVVVPRLAQPSLHQASPPAAYIQSAITAPPLRTPGLAVASLVMGILGILTGWVCCGSIFPILAIVFGHVAYSSISRQPTEFTGKGLAIAGFVLGYVGLIVSVLITLLFGIFSAVMEAASQKL